jgi:hypothetical protein
MCSMNKYEAWKLVSKDMDVLALVGDKETIVTIDRSYGNIVGISIGESYTRPQLGQVNLTMTADSTERIVNTPLTQFLPDGERQMWPIRIEAGTVVKVKLTIRVVGLVVAIPLIFHLEKPNC